MPRPAVEKTNPRRVVAGTVVRIPNGPDEVVRGVSIILHMANGQDVPYTEDEEVAILAKQPVLISEAEVPAHSHQRVAVGPAEPLKVYESENK